MCKILCMLWAYGPWLVEAALCSFLGGGGGGGGGKATYKKNAGGSWGARLGLSRTIHIM